MLLGLLAAGATDGSDLHLIACEAQQHSFLHLLRPCRAVSTLGLCCHRLCPCSLLVPLTLPLATETDKKCEELILTRIRDAFPDHKFIGEEGSAAQVNAGRLRCRSGRRSKAVTALESLASSPRDAWGAKCWAAPAMVWSPRRCGGSYSACIVRAIHSPPAIHTLMPTSVQGFTDELTDAPTWMVDPVDGGIALHPLQPRWGS